MKLRPPRPTRTDTLLPLHDALPILGGDDHPAQLGFTIDPQRLLRGIAERLLVVDQIARQHEHPRHPEDHEDDVRGLHPQIGGAEKTDHAPPLTRATRRSTCAIGVSWPMPCPNFKTFGLLWNGARMRATHPTTRAHRARKAEEAKVTLQ